MPWSREPECLFRLVHHAGDRPYFGTPQDLLSLAAWQLRDLAQKDLLK